MRRILGIALAGLATLAGNASAQRVVGRIIEETTLAPIGGAFITIFDEDGARLGSFLTDDTGSFAFDLPRPGTFTMRAERIGHRVTTAGPFTAAAADTLTLEISAPAEAVALEGIAVRGEGRCTVRPAAAAAAARVWEEARKVFEITLWSRDAARLQFRATQYTRMLDPRGNILAEQVRAAPASGYRAWRTADLDILDRVGYVQAIGDSIDFYAPDAEVFLSDHFLDRHCIEAIAGEGEFAGLVGLAFRPAPDRQQPDIAGTLWLDAKTSELRHLDYAYVQASHLVPVERAIGRIAFARTPGGIWYVDEWWIRMPRAVSNNRSLDLDGWREKGGIVLEVVGDYGGTPVSARRRNDAIGRFAGNGATNFSLTRR